jgi:hypothetical protein
VILTKKIKPHGIFLIIVQVFHNICNKSKFGNLKYCENLQKFNCRYEFALAKPQVCVKEYKNAGL